MKKSLTDVITNQTNRALWEVRNVIDCVPEELWSREYCEMPLYKHIYHMLHSLDLWYINPNDQDYKEPSIHIDSLNDLDAVTNRYISKTEIFEYFDSIKFKISAHRNFSDDAQLIENHADRCTAN